MRNLLVVFQFEYMQQLRKKAFLISTILIAAVLCVGVAVSPILIRSAMKAQSGSSSQVSTSRLHGGVYYEDESLQGLLPFRSGHEYENEESLKKAIKSGDESIGFVIVDETHFRTYYTGLTSLDEMSNVRDAMKQLYIKQALEERGVSEEEYQKISEMPITGEQENLSGGAEGNPFLLYFGSMAFVVIVYVVILLYGQTVATAVAREKDSKTMELLITTTRANDLILGKVFAIIALVLTALAVYLAAVLVPYLIVRRSYPLVVRVLLQGSFAPSELAVFLLYFVISLFMYMFLFAALGSLVSRVEDVGAAITPVMLFVILAYILAFMTMNGMNNAIVQIGSWIPFFSVFIMPIRFASGFVSAVSVLIAAVVSVAFTIFLAWLSARIYRMGSLRYGNRISFFQALRLAFGKK